jgi:hypothetical protein
LGIICREVPSLVKQAECDREDGWRRDQPALRLPAGLTDSAVADVEANDLAEPFLEHAPSLLSMFRAWRMDNQAIDKEFGSSSFVTAASQTAAVGSGMLSGDRGGLPPFFGGALRWLHGIALGAYGAIRAAIHSLVSGLTFAVALAILVVVALYTSAALAALVVPLAVGAAAMFVAAAVARAGRWWWVVCLGLAAAAALAIALAASMITGNAQSALAAAVIFVIGVVVTSVSTRWRWLAYVSGLVSVVLVGLAFWAYVDLRNSASCSAHPSSNATSCAEAYVDSNRWLVLLSIGVVLPIAIGSRSLSRAAQAAAEAP